MTLNETFYTTSIYCISAGKCQLNPTPFFAINNVIPIFIKFNQNNTDNLFVGRQKLNDMLIPGNPVFDIIGKAERQLKFHLWRDFFGKHTIAIILNNFKLYFPGLDVYDFNMEDKIRQRSGTDSFFMLASRLIQVDRLGIIGIRTLLK